MARFEDTIAANDSKLLMQFLIVFLKSFYDFRFRALALLFRNVILCL